MAISKDGSIQQIRDQNYYIEIVFYNQIEGEQPIRVPFFFVDYLTIHETLQYWPTSAEIVINTDFELFNRGITAKIFPSPDNSQKIEGKPLYIDRPDGRNRVSIRIYPINIDRPDENAYPKEKWEMSYDFVVTDVEDLDSPNAQRKRRKYTLVDERYQILSERNLEWSTANYKAKEIGKAAYQLTDDEASMNPNLLLKEIIKLSGTNLKGSTSETIKVGYLEGGSITDPTIDFGKINEEKWDLGNDENKLKANTVADSFAIDDINYILAHCVSSTNKPVILDFGRSSEKKEWHLISLEDIFKTSTDEQVERLIIEDSLGDEDSPPYVSRASLAEITNTKNFTSIIASRIKKYKFSPRVATDDNQLMNKPLHWFDHSLGEFNLKMKNNSAVAVLETMKEMARSGLFSFSTGWGSQIISVVNQTKAKGYMTKNELSFSNRFISPVATRNQMLLDLLFLNQSISFQALGLTIRAPGRFIFIDRVGSVGAANAFDDRFLGQWLVTGVKHYFSSKTYITEVVATKVDSFGKLWPEIDSKY